MPYDIEVMCVGVDHYDLLERSVRQMNSVQTEFRFRTTSPGQREPGLGFTYDAYHTDDIWKFLREQRERFGGRRDYIIAFVDRPIQSSVLANLFGSHVAEEGLAVVTLHGSQQYVKEARRYCTYYLTRYALSFVNPDIRSHDDAERSRCYFHRKIRKADIRDSMDSGYLCDSCRRRLDDPGPGSTGHKLSDDERKALVAMRDVVSGAYPRALVMKGGGVKGLALAGALLELQQHFYFDRHVGTSAGSIAAVLLACGYTPAELRDTLQGKNFKDFKDAPFWRLPFNLLLKGGLYPGDHFRTWLDDMLRDRIKPATEVYMSTLKTAVVYASRPGEGTITFDSTGQRSDAIAAFAVRCSMSIPIFFYPQHTDGRRTRDGGLRTNFPVKKFLDDNGNVPFIGLYLKAPRAKNAWLGSELMDIFIEGDEREIVERHATSMVVIDPSPIETVDFTLTQQEKDFLLSAGRAAALEFLAKQNLDDGPDEHTVHAAQSAVEAQRRAVKRRRARRKTFRALAAAIIVIALLFRHELYDFARGVGERWLPRIGLTIVKAAERFAEPPRGPFC